MGVEGTGEVGEPDTSEGLKYPGDGAPPGPGSKRVSSRWGRSATATSLLGRTLDGMARARTLCAVIGANAHAAISHPAGSDSMGDGWLDDVGGGCPL
jgi:hypothetical protein